MFCIQMRWRGLDVLVSLAHFARADQDVWSLDLGCDLDACVQLVV